MANIKFNLISKSNPSNLNIRFYHGKEVDCNARSNILINPNYWSNKMQSLKPSISKTIKDHYREKIENLKNEIIFRFNDDYITGTKIDSKWLTKVVQEFYNRPKENEDSSVYFNAFVKKYIEESKLRVDQKTGKRISQGTLKKYQNTLNHILNFEKRKNQELKLSDINLNFHKEFTNFLKVDCNYSNTFIHRTISQIKSFLREARLKGHDISNDFESRKFTFTRDEAIDTYLNEKEIEILFNLDLSQNEKLDNVRDLFIIGLWTGLRVSDLMRINEFQISKNTILIDSTEKTSANVEIPIHPQIKSILKKRNQNLPRTISDQNFNKYVKELCLKAGLTQKILGNLKNPETNRKERGYYEKYKLVSSHTCRRSFATNLYGKIDDKTIMAITTHKSHSQFMSYIKTTQKEHVQKLAEYWKTRQNTNIIT